MIQVEERLYWKEKVNGDISRTGKTAVYTQDTSDLFSVLQDVELHLQNHGLKYLASEEKPSIADASAFPFLWRLSVEFGLREFPQLNDWLTRMIACEAVQQTVCTPWWWWW